MDEEVRRLYFESLLNKVDTAVLVTDREGAIEWKNRAADALLDTRCRLPNEFLEAIKAGKTVVRYGKPSVPQDWAIDATRIDLRGCERWIVSLKNIHSTLERNEDGGLAEIDPCLDARDHELHHTRYLVVRDFEQALQSRSG